MKKLILSSLLILAVISLKAQSLPGYTGDSGTVQGNGYIYKYNNKINPGYLTLYNAENRLTGVDWEMKDGSPVPDILEVGYTPTHEYHDGTYNLLRSIVQDAFNSLLTNEQRMPLNGKKLFIDTKIDSSTGRMMEVEISFFLNSPFRYVPVEVYRKIELDLKSGISFIPTSHGKKFNYCIWAPVQEFEYTYISPIDPKPPVDPNPKDPNKPVNPGEPDPQLPIDWLQSVPGKPATSQAPKSELE